MDGRGPVGEGQSEILLRQLSRRFGALPPTAAERVRTADSDTLGRWAEAVLDAPSLDDVFAA